MSPLPSRGNPARRLAVLLAVTFGVMLVGFVVGGLLTGQDGGSIALVALGIALGAVVTLGAVLVVSAMFQADHEILLNGSEVLAAWTLSPREHEAFAAGERRRTRGLVAMFAGVGAVLGVVTAPFDVALGASMAVTFGGIALMAGYLGRLPPAAGTDAGRQVLIGWAGAQVLGAYRPFQAPQLRLTRIELERGFPAVLRFRYMERHRPGEVRVPVPDGRVAEARALIARFRAARLLRE